MFPILLHFEAREDAVPAVIFPAIAAFAAAAAWKRLQPWKTSTLRRVWGDGDGGGALSFD